LKISNLTKTGVSNAIAERVQGIGGSGGTDTDKSTFTLIIEPDDRAKRWLLISVEEEVGTAEDLE